MARFFSGAKIMSGLVPRGVFNPLIRRVHTGETMGASISVAEGVLSAGSDGIMMKKDREMKKEEVETSTENAWLPDPVTGYYRPENYVGGIDPVDIRAKLLKPRRV